MRVLSWALNRPGFAMAQQVIWREVRNADLPAGLDARAWLRAELMRTGHEGAIGFLTSRDVTRFCRASAVVEGCRADCVATVGLGNAERIGQRVPRGPQDWGTINIALRIGPGLTRTALIEALSIVASARTAAILDAGLELPTGVATGTGTDCIAVAAPPGRVAYCGMHTPLGEAIGAAAYRTVLQGARYWQAEQGDPTGNAPPPEPGTEPGTGRKM
ncbi:adenosylcobinamide amidohydrolase [Tabrizicola sp. DMG-N-6]|uniref:Adenosylcobinamide amidohydrolase n=2 Tax=Szabonella alba TaxID=2804194 RepID=A0A8K0Y1Z9_9RHOB|nr:adenosylcobinamide amidohydrolase [Szabonella alba]